jgi:transposase
VRLPPLVVSDADRAELQRRVRSHTSPQRDVTRARIVLLAAEGGTNRAIASQVGLHHNQVGIWRQRYAARGLAGLAEPKRPGRPVVYDHDARLLILKTVTEHPPAPASRWTMAAVARRLEDQVGISASQVWRICRALDLKPWQVRSWMTSHDPDFLAKAAEVCGLYLHPPQGAVVFSVDEKTGMQARSRVNPTIPAMPGRPARQEFEYRRHGTAVLFAALDVHHGQVIPQLSDSSRSANFVAFLADLDAAVPADQALHVIADNLSAHKTLAVREFLAAHPRISLHHTPTHASWLNQVELFFSILARGLLKGGEFRSVEDLVDKVMAFIADYNQRAKPFRWTYDGRPLQIT